MILQYDRILVAVDGSKEAEWAFQKSIGIAQRNRAALFIVNILDARLFQGNKMYDSSVMRGGEQQARKAAEKLLNRYKAEAEAAGVKPVEIIIERGSPRVTIPRGVARKIDADLIICGASGLNRVERFIMGSVSQSIARMSACDVLVVRTEEEIDEAAAEA
ncbi:universal stress protein [Planococcus lenghuensis]|uniref:Universal stress protein n=1 Tax=Planococcus lenghuensis TaxID=2213202 RepID=A0A1Q2KY02_9BACL|nr:universal stress protein [Planococcus lenghuensis]AQQ53081.1 universal stress protein UspA [Planococcus lenghuensis]